jgi:hypothetical protein
LTRILHYTSKEVFLQSIRTVLISMMVVFISLCQPLASSAQLLSGQWIGGFGSQEEVNGRKTNYVLEMEFNGTKISGYSYTYFAISGKQYFVICKLSGTFDKASKSMIVNEIEKVKTNTPPDFENCLQSHQLTYLKQKDREILVGKWKPYIKESNCGSGETELERKKLEKIPVPKTQQPAIVKKDPSKVPPAKQPLASSPKPVPAPQEKKSNTNPVSKPPVKNLITQTKPSPEPKENSLQQSPPPIPQQTIPPVTEKKNFSKTLHENTDGRPKPLVNKPKEKFNKRTYEVIKTIEVTGTSIKVDMYDNGQVDGDTVSIFLNEKLLVPAKMLTAQPISLNIKLDEDEDTYDLIMYAESMGSIPPNTAFMIVTTSTARYEINITSTEQTSGAIRFKVKR